MRFRDTFPMKLCFRVLWLYIIGEIFSLHSITAWEHIDEISNLCFWDPSVEFLELWPKERHLPQDLEHICCSINVTSPVFQGPSAPCEIPWYSLDISVPLPIFTKMDHTHSHRTWLGHSHGINAACMWIFSKQWDTFQSFCSPSSWISFFHMVHMLPSFMSEWETKFILWYGSWQCNIFSKVPFLAHGHVV